MTDPLLLTSAGIASSGFAWLLRQTGSQGRMNWLTTVVIPGVMSGYSLFAMHGGPHAGMGGLLGFGAAGLSGMFFDQNHAFNRSGGEATGRRSRLPLILWGLGSLSFVTGPLSGGAMQLSGMLTSLGGGAIGGQALNWASRLHQAGQAKPAAGILGSRLTSAPWQSRAAGIVTAAVAALLLRR